MNKKDRMKEWRSSNKFKEHMKEYRKTDVYKKAQKKCMKNYRKTDVYKDSIKRGCMKRKRNLGFNPLNRPFFGSVGHHINNNDIIYMPEEIHRAIPHCVSTGKNMNMINQIAVLYLNKEVFKAEF